MVVVIMGSKQLVFGFMILVLLAVVAVNGTTDDNIPSTNYEEGKDHKDVVKEKAAETAKEGKDTESWTGWAKEKLTEGLGLKDDDAPRKATDSTVGSAQKTKDKVQDLVFEAGQYSTEKARDTKDAAAEKVSEIENAATEKDGDITNAAKEKVGTTTEKSSDATNAANEKARNIKDEETGKAGRGHDDEL